MSVIAIKRVSDFRGEDVTLLAVDVEGRDAFLGALMQACQLGAARLKRPSRSHDFVVVAGAAEIEIGDDRVVWRLDPDKAREIIAKSRSLGGNGHSGHHYVDDMQGPAPTLVLSLNEYLTPSWLTAGNEPIFTDDDLD
jgi:hypothetical protein